MDGFFFACGWSQSPSKKQTSSCAQWLRWAVLFVGRKQNLFCDDHGGCMMNVKSLKNAHETSHLKLCHSILRLRPQNQGGNRTNCWISSVWRLRVLISRNNFSLSTGGDRFRRNFALSLKPCTCNSEIPLPEQRSCTACGSWSAHMSEIDLPSTTKWLLHSKETFTGTKPNTNKSLFCSACLIART